MFRFADSHESDLKNSLTGEDCYVLVHAKRDLVWLSAVLYEADTVFVETQRDLLADDYVVPEITSEYMLLIVEDGLLTPNQKVQLSDDNKFSVDTSDLPVLLKTREDVVNDIENTTGYSYDLIYDYPLFIGRTGLYEVDK